MTSSTITRIATLLLLCTLTLGNSNNPALPTFKLPQLQKQQTVPHSNASNNALAVPPGGSATQTISDDAYRSAVLKTTLAVSSACAFGLGLFKYRGLKTAQEFFAGYLVEQSLSVDNLFVFIMLFDYFRVPINLQERVLNYGIFGAIVMRGVMIGVGVKAIQQFKSVILLFSGILVASSIKLLMEGIDGGSSHGGSSEEISPNGIMKLTSWLFKSTPHFDGEKFFTFDKTQGRNVATPLFMCLICIELSDFVFAVDSIPAVIGVTKDPMVVYSSNIFAIMALRSLYVLVARAINDLPFLRPAVALVLGFIGLKMLGEYFHIEISTGTSLTVVSTLLGCGIGASLIEKRRKGAMLGGK